jgi:hypothetical protein
MIQVEHVSLGETMLQPMSLVVNALQGTQTSLRCQVRNSICSAIDNAWLSMFPRQSHDEVSPGLFYFGSVSLSHTLVK